MWKRLLYTEFYLTFQHNNLMDIIVTDFVSVWFKNMQIGDFLAVMKESNMQLEINENEIIAKGIEMLQKPEELKDAQASEDESENLNLNLMKSFGFPVRLKVTLCKGLKELFFQKVTFPLLQSTRDLKESQGELCQLLLRKDQEIQEYKEEGGRIALRHLKTPKFDDAKHLLAHNSYSNYFAFEQIPDSLMDKIKTVTVSIKQEAKIEFDSSLRIKQEPDPLLVKQESVILKKEPDKVVDQQPFNVVNNEPVLVKQEVHSQPSQSCLASPRKRPRKLMNL